MHSYSKRFYFYKYDIKAYRDLVGKKLGIPNINDTLIRTKEGGGSGFTNEDYNNRMNDIIFDKKTQNILIQLKCQMIYTIEKFSWFFSLGNHSVDPPKGKSRSFPSWKNLLKFSKSLCWNSAKFDTSKVGPRRNRRNFRRGPQGGPQNRWNSAGGES